MDLTKIRQQIMFILLLIAVILAFPGISLADKPVVNIISTTRTVINDDPVDLENDPDGSGHSLIVWDADWEEASQNEKYKIERVNGTAITITASTTYSKGEDITTEILPEHLEEGSNTIKITVTVTITDPTEGATSINITLDTEDPPVPTGLTAEPGDEKAFLSWDSKATDDTDTAGYIIYYVEVTDATSLGTTDPNEYNYDKDVGNTNNYEITGLNNDTAYAFAISAYDEATNEGGLYAGQSGVGIVVAPVNAVGLGALTEEEGGCFIATAAFGSYQSRYVKPLRDFRDKYLITNEWGRNFVDWYYQSSPYLANHISKSEFLKSLARILLIPFIALSLFLTKTTLIQKCFLLLCLSSFSLIWLVRRKTALKKALIIVTLSFLLIFFSSPAWAQQFQSPQHYSIELKGASYSAQDVDPVYELIYGSDKGFLFEFELGWQILDLLGILGVDAGVGYFQQTGNGLVVPETFIDPENWEKSNEEYVFRIVPAEVSIVYRLVYFKNQVIVPFVKGGVDYYYFRESRKDGEEVFDGGKWGYHFSGGGQLLLDYFDLKHANKMDTDYGINNTYLIFEYRKAEVDDFGEEGGFDFSNSTWFGGLMFEF
ncbi:MAG: outer membrane beta-barrel protein [Deltaproteobacteria bacterium]|nr:MAG: outer membrane beta-barrel protein [Deltaproteobacteria bacterium]